MTKTDRAKRLQELAQQIRVCVKCPLHASRTLAVPGDGSPVAVMIIGEAPGAEEDKSGHPFVGAAGRFLDSVLEGSGIDRADFFITNIVKCRPPGNRTPKRASKKGSDPLAGSGIVLAPGRNLGKGEGV